MNIVFNNRKFVLEYDNGEQLILFDSMDFKSNCSRLCFHSMTDEGNVVPQMYDFLKTTIGELNDGNSRNALFRAVAYLLILRELIKKYRAYRILYMGETSSLIEYIAQLLQMIHPKARLYCIAEECSELKDSPVVMIQAECSIFPFPHNYFDVVLTNETHSDIMRRIFTDVISAIVPGGLFITLPAMHGDDSWLGEFAESIGEIPGHQMMYLSIPLEKEHLLRRIDKGLLVIKKETILSTFIEIEHDIASLDVSVSPAVDTVLTSLIKKVGHIESDICEIYENLISLHVKYKVNLLKEALIKYRIERDEKELLRRKAKIDECLHQLKEELKVDFRRYFM